MLTRVLVPRGGVTMELISQVGILYLNIVMGEGGASKIKEHTYKVYANISTSECMHLILAK